MYYNFLNLMNVVSSFSLAFLIMVQTTETGELLVANYKGLILVVMVLLTSALWNSIGMLVHAIVAE